METLRAAAAATTTTPEFVQRPRQGGTGNGEQVCQSRKRHTTGALLPAAEATTSAKGTSVVVAKDKSQQQQPLGDTAYSRKRPLVRQEKVRKSNIEDCSIMSSREDASPGIDRSFGKNVKPAVRMEKPCFEQTQTVRPLGSAAPLPQGQGHPDSHRRGNGSNNNYNNGDYQRRQHERPLATRRRPEPRSTRSTRMAETSTTTRTRPLDVPNGGRRGRNLNSNPRYSSDNRTITHKPSNSSSTVSRHYRPPPPPPTSRPRILPQGHPAQQRATAAARNHNGRLSDCHRSSLSSSSPESKRPRMSSFVSNANGNPSSSWHSRHRHDVSVSSSEAPPLDSTRWQPKGYAPQQSSSSSAAAAAAHQEKKKLAFAGRFVPKGKTEERGRNNETFGKATRNCETRTLDNSLMMDDKRKTPSLQTSKTGTTCTALLEKSKTASRLLSSEGRSVLDETRRIESNINNRETALLNNQSRKLTMGEAHRPDKTIDDDMLESQTELEEAHNRKHKEVSSVGILVKLPPSLESQGKHSLDSDIHKDDTNAAIEMAYVSHDHTELRTSASYSSCSVLHNASVTPSVEIMESPHSLTLADEDMLELDKKKADEQAVRSPIIVNVPAVDELQSLEKGDTEYQENATQRGTTEVNEMTRQEGSEPRDPEDADVVAEAAAKAKTVSPVIVNDQQSLKTCDKGDPQEDTREEVEVKGLETNDAEGAKGAEAIVEDFGKEDTGPPASTAVAEFDTSLGKEADNESSDSSDDETDEEELQQWAQKMFGIPPPIAVPKRSEEQFSTWSDSSDEESESEPKASDEMSSSRRPNLTLHLKLVPAVDAPAKRKRRRKAVFSRKKIRGASKAKAPKAAREEKKQAEELLLVSQEVKRKKEEARPLTVAEVRKILEEDKGCCGESHWVRRSSRQPSRAVLNAPGVRSLIDKLRVNDYDMVVLKMKKYCSDPDTPSVVIDSALDALEENTNCQALYIQNFNEGMRDEQVLHLLRILQMPSCNIWCLNIGETYNVKTRTWKLFTKGLKQTKITHMYASEHTISTVLKDEIRATIRDNRSKHDMHCNPENLDVIVQCTHCWWNPINTKSLRPYLSKRGMEYILNDREAQGLLGSSSLPAAGDAAPGGNNYT